MSYTPIHNGRPKHGREGFWPRRLNSSRGTTHKSARDALRAEANCNHTVDAETQALLASRVKEGDWDAFEELVRGLMRLVLKIARRFRSSGVGEEDLIAEGRVGIRDAALHYDPARGAEFPSLVSTIVRRRMIELIRRHGNGAMRVPREAGRLMRAARDAATRLAAQGVVFPDAVEVARETGISVRRLRGVSALTRPVVALDATAGPGLSSLGDLTADEASATPREILDVTEQREALARAMTDLGARHRRILTLRFGLDGGEERTHAQIGHELGLTKERARQLCEEAIVLVRRRMHALNAAHASGGGSNRE